MYDESFRIESNRTEPNQLALRWTSRWYDSFFFFFSHKEEIHASMMKTQKIEKQQDIEAALIGKEGRYISTMFDRQACPRNSNVE